jgi:hypothetical protein
VEQEVLEDVGKKMVEGVIEEDVVEDLIKGGYVRVEVEGDMVEKNVVYQELVVAEEVEDKGR